jgi:ATP-dependent Clp protease adaptor protein ClpS
MADTKTVSLPSVKPKNDVKPPQAWNVVLLNDEEHTYEYVIRMMQQLFGHGEEKAFKIAQTVDTEGRAVCLTTHKEHAEFKRDQILAFGRDPLMAESKGSMTAIIEPAEFGGEDDAGKGDQGGSGGKSSGS